MSGIAGRYNINKEKVSLPYIKKMADKIIHRGPDGEEYYIDNNVGLGYQEFQLTNNSERNTQQREPENERYIVFFDGEIYNILELKEMLTKKNYNFVSSTEKEILIGMYKEFGKKMLENLRGIFALCIYDKEKNEIFIARDRFGAKPLYYYIDDNKFLFCSEIKGILEDSSIKRIANELPIYDFLVYNRTDYLEETCFKNINNVLPGHYIVVNEKGLEKKKWYDLVLPEEEFSEDEAIKVFKKDLQETISLYTKRDKKLGACLSGGLDSSTIVKFASDELPEKSKFKTVSAVYNPKWEKDESKYIDDVVEYTGVKNIKVRPEAKELVEEIENLIYHQEEPFKSTSIFASWKVAETASKNQIKVLLDGQGADELLGYGYMVAYYFYELLSLCKISRFVRELFFFIKKQKYGKVFSFSLFVYLFLPPFLKKKVLSQRYKWLDKDFGSKYQEHSIVEQEFLTAKSLNKSVLNHLKYKLTHMFRFEDKNSMAFSVEKRMPFLDNILVENALKIPSSMKIKDGEVKYILKHVMRYLLPKSVVERHNKIGFETPEETWFKNKDVLRMFDEVFESKSFKRRKYYNHSLLLVYMEELKAGSTKHKETLWKVFCLETWFKVFNVKNFSNAKK